MTQKPKNTASLTISIEEGAKLIGVDNVQAHTILTQAKEEALANNWIVIAANASRELAWLHIKLYSPPEALELINEIYDVYENQDMQIELADCWHLRGWVYYLLGDHESRLEANVEQLRIFEKLNLRKKIPTALINLGDNYNQLKQHNKAHEVLDYCLDHFELNDEDKAYVFQNKAETYFKEGKFSEAKSFFQQSEHLYNSESNLSFRCARNTMLAEIFILENNLPEAYECVNRSIEIANKANNKFHLALAYQTLANCHQAAGELGLALETHKQYATLKLNTISVNHSLRIKSIKYQKEIRRINLEKEKAKIRNAELEAMNEELKDFAHIISHDLKEPIRAIQFHVNDLNKRPSNSTDENDKSLKEIELITNRMNSLVSDILNYATIGASEEDSCSFNSQKVFEEVLSNLASQIQQSGATIKSMNLPILHGNVTHFAQLLQNLISNSLKFRQKGVAPKVLVLGQENENNYIIRINDNGIGILTEEAKNVFKVFKRLNHRDDFTGSGIGLATCSRIVERFGGRIWVDTSYTNGTSMVINIPKS